MEAEFLKIMQNNFGNLAGRIQAAIEIQKVVIKFIDWLAKEVTLKLVWHDDIGYTKEWHYLPDKWGSKQGKCWSLNELFQYWNEEINKDENKVTP